MQLPPTTQPDAFAEAFGEPMTHILNMATWHDGQNLATLYAQLHKEVAESVAQANRTADPIRSLVFPRIASNGDRYAPKNAGVYKLTANDVECVHCNLLFNGATECCDGTIAAHDTLLLSVVQIGIALVAYQGGQNTWVNRLYRRDLRTHHPDPMEEAIALLEKRGQQHADAENEPTDGLSRLVRRALMEYAERAALANLSKTVWRMGHGSPVPTDLLLLTGTATKDLQTASMNVMRELIGTHKRFVYVVSNPADRLLLTIGSALLPLEYAIVETMQGVFDKLRLIESRRAGAERKHVTDFMEEIGPQVVMGVYRAAKHAPPHVFYAHKDFAHEAAALAIADSALQPLRGFPMLIDLADNIAGNTFDGGSFHGSLQNAYAAAGEPTRYAGERETRS